MAGSIVKVSGPLIVAEGMADVKVYDVVRVSQKRLIGEIIELRDDRASIQVYEETSGLGPGEPVETTGNPLSVELAPGLIESIFDGIQRPLEVVRETVGDRITRGVEVGIVELCIAVTKINIFSALIGIIVSAAISFFAVKLFIFIVNKKALNYIAYYDISIGVISAIIGAFQLVIK